MTAADLPAIPYGRRTLAELLPSALAALGVEGEANPLGLAPSRRVVVLLVDGLGWNLLRRNTDAAPFLGSVDTDPLTVGFPSTTVTSLTSLGTGLAPGEHGMTGYTSFLGEIDEVVNWLTWRPVGAGGNDLRERVAPERIQPRRTALERGAAAGVAVTVASATEFRTSGMTRAALRGGTFSGTFTHGDVIATVVEASRPEPSLVYCYVSELDLIGHVRGPETAPWLAQLALVDSFVEQLRARLDPDTTLLVTGDHGMVHVPEASKIDYDALPELQDGVVALAGEPRARYVHTAPGADVRARWTDVLGDRFAIFSRDEASAAGLFGPTVTPAASGRIGDLVVVARDGSSIVQRTAEPRMSALPGMHGALTDDERLVPLLVFAPS